MRTSSFAAFSVSVVALAVIGLTGCVERQNLAAVPNREGHASGPASTLGDEVNRPVARRTEKYYTIEAGDDVYKVAKKFNVTTEWLIKRNDIRTQEGLKPGNSLIVPAAR
jgi:LysM repeat protein